jgi:ArsR family transcriptional regulator
MNSKIIPDLDFLAAGLKIMAEPNRLRILYLLKDNPLCLCELEFILELSQPTITHHIKKLKSAGLITLEKEGRWTISKMVNPDILQYLTSIFQLLETRR